MNAILGSTILARPIEFDRDHALNAAMKLFWRQGYTATSLSQLLAIMDISKSSFYAAFTDKHSLYAEALDLFGDRSRNIFLDTKQDHSALESVRLFFENTLFNVPSNRRRCGCMMVNTILELSDVEQALCDLASKKLDQIEEELEKSFSESFDSGALNFNQSPKDIARFVMTINQGLRVSSRKNLTNKELRAIVDTTMDTLSFAFN